MAIENWGDYWWPDQLDVCMRNKLGIHDPDLLRDEERRYGWFRTAELLSGKTRVEPSFDLEHLRGIHRHLLGDVYEWAGQLRVSDLVRPDIDPDRPGHAFIPPDQIEALAPRVFALADPDALTGRPRAEQAEHLAQLYNGLNMLHPFVEGNGRSSRLFLGDLAGACGVAIDWSRFDRQNEVMKEAFEVGPAGLVVALEGCLVGEEEPGWEDARLSMMRVSSTEELEAAPRESPDVEQARITKIRAAMQADSTTPSLDAGPAAVRDTAASRARRADLER